MASDPGLNFVAMTMPSSGTFEERFDFTRAVESYTLNDRFSDLSDGQMGILATFPHANELLKVDRADHNNDLGTVVRVLRGTTPVAHFVMRRIDRKWSSNLNVKPALLDGAEFFLDRQTVPNFDYPAVPMRNPDWIYGAESVFEGPGGEIAFELQAIYRESTVTTGNFRLNFGGNQTPDLAWNSSAGQIATALEDLASIDEVTVDGTGVPFDPWTIEFIVPAGNVAQLTISNSTLDGNMFVTTLRAGGSLDPRPWTPSFHPVTKLFHSTYTFFQMVEPPDPVYLDDTHSLAIDADTPPYPTDYGGAQVIVNVVGGGLYRAELPIYSPTSQLVRFIIRDMNEGHIASLEHTTAVATWEVLEIEGIQIPIGVDQVIFRIGLITSGDPGIIYISPKYALLAPGFKAATLGKILGDILVAIQAQGDFLWVTKTFTDTHDSKGVEWDQTLSWGVHHGQSLLQLHEYANRWNYRWGFEFNINTEAWNWQAYNPGTTLADIEGFAITGHDGVIGSGTISTKIPEATHYQADGEGGEWGEFTDTTMTGVWGRLHKYYSNVQGMASSDLAVLAERLVDHASEYTEGLMVELTNPNLLPWEHFKKGDSLTVDMEPEFPLGQMPVMSIVASKEPKNDPVYNVHFNSVVFEGEAAIAENLRRLIRAFRAEQFNQVRGTVDPAGLSGGGGGEATIVVASSEATEYSKSKADFVCSGVDDQVIIQAALDQAFGITGWGGDVVLTEGGYYVTIPPAGGSAIFVGALQTLSGTGGGRQYGGSAIYMVWSADQTAKGWAIDTDTGATIRDLVIDTSESGGNIGGLRMDVQVVADNVVFYPAGFADDDSAIDIRFGAVNIRDCIFSGTGDQGNHIQVEATSANKHGITVTNCFFDAMHTAIAFDRGTGSIQRVSITNNDVLSGSWRFVAIGTTSTIGGVIVIANNNVRNCQEEAIELIQCDYVTITGNNILGVDQNDSGRGGIVIDRDGAGEGATLIANNNLEAVHNGPGIYCIGLINSIIASNYLEDIAEHGIYLSGCSDMTVEGNVIRDAGFGDGSGNDFDGILLDGDSDANLIFGNRIGIAVGGTQMRYGINISAGTCNNNVYYGNMVETASVATAAYNNAGTGTQNTMPGAGGAQGDNFVF